MKATLIDRCFLTGIMAGPKPHIISLTKREGHGYGFYLRVEHGEEGHLIRALEMGGAAELAGLKDGDRIVRVNKTFVDNLEHSQVWCFWKCTFCKSCIIYFNIFYFSSLVVDLETCLLHGSGCRFGEKERDERHIACPWRRGIQDSQSQRCESCWHSVPVGSEPAHHEWSVCTSR